MVAISGGSTAGLFGGMRNVEVIVCDGAELGMIADDFERRLISAATIASGLQPGDTSGGLSSFYPAQLVNIAGRVHGRSGRTVRIHGRMAHAARESG